jgi:DNA-binding IclR family transcriptional regulator
MAGILDRALRMLELLARAGGGLPLHSIADQLSIPRSAAHRLLQELAQQGYVRQVQEGGAYAMTIRFAALGLNYLARSGVTDVAQPILQQLATATGELARLSVVEDRQLTWVAKAEGTRHDLRYDPDSGLEVHLASTASGHAWLASLPEEEALSLAARQGFDRPEASPQATRGVQALQRGLRLARAKGYAVAVETYASGTAAAAAAVRHPVDGRVIGVVNIAGPSVRLTRQRLQDCVPYLLTAAAEMSEASAASPILGARVLPSSSDRTGP